MTRHVRRPVRPLVCACTYKRNVCAGATVVSPLALSRRWRTCFLALYRVYRVSVFLAFGTRARALVKSYPLIVALPSPQRSKCVCVCVSYNYNTYIESRTVDCVIRSQFTTLRDGATQCVRGGQVTHSVHTLPLTSGGTSSNVFIKGGSGYPSFNYLFTCFILS